MRLLKEGFYHKVYAILNDEIEEVRAAIFLIALRMKRETHDEKEIPYMTVSIKADEEVKMGTVIDVKQELRKANALKINYSTRKGTY